jgi:1-aminocyclopropane-1-carboxylate deaminase/D-cysteine desulfhydrase-like pyridoxal-dependent ACC family enzyme
MWVHHHRGAECGRSLFLFVGGSSALGCWGYLYAAQEIADQEKGVGQHFEVLALVSVCSVGCFLLLCVL